MGILGVVTFLLTPLNARYLSHKLTARQLLLPVTLHPAPYSNKTVMQLTLLPDLHHKNTLFFSF